VNVFTAALARLIALSACAAVLLTEHLRLAVRARRTDGTRALAAALLVPGAGAVFAWRDGSRVAPIAYAALVLGYAALGLWH
jgi:hypothetical protein